MKRNQKQVRRESTSAAPQSQLKPSASSTERDDVEQWLEEFRTAAARGFTELDNARDKANALFSLLAFYMEHNDGYSNVPWPDGVICGLYGIKEHVTEEMDRTIGSLRQLVITHCHGTKPPVGASLEVAIPTALLPLIDQAASAEGCDRETFIRNAVSAKIAREEGGAR